RLEHRLRGHPFLLGDQVTETDWRLFTTLARFDAVYYGHVKCNRDRLAGFPELWDFTRTPYQGRAGAETGRLDHIKTHYYGSHPRSIRPASFRPGIVSTFPRRPGVQCRRSTADAGRPGNDADCCHFGGGVIRDALIADGLRRSIFVCR